MSDSTDDLASLTTRELQNHYARVFGTPTNSRNRDYLRRRLQAAPSAQATAALPPALEAALAPLEGHQEAPPTASAPAAEPASDHEPMAPPGALEAVPVLESVERSVPSEASGGIEPELPSLPPPSSSAPPRRRRQVVPTGTRDPRLPAAGTVITRASGNRVHAVTVGEADFEYEGTRWTSLSALARHIAGTTWNGLLFFKLIPYARRTLRAA